MSVSLDRFKRVMTRGHVVTDQLVVVRDGKVGAALALLQAELNRLTAGGLRDLPLEGVQQNLINRRAAALALGGNAAKCDALEGVKTDARAAATDASIKVDTLLARAAKVTEIDARLAELRDAGLKVVDAPMQTAAAQKVTALTTRRDTLAGASGGALALELAKAPILLADIQSAKGLAEQYASWGKSKATRTLIQGACAGYAAQGKKKNLDWLEQGAVKVTIDLAKVVAGSLADTQGAITDLNTVQLDYSRLKTRFLNEVMGPTLEKLANDKAAGDPTGAEAMMKQALSPADFKQRLLEVYNTGIAFGTNMKTLSPGENVAVYTYTSDDYTEMNALLLGLPQAPTVDLAKVKIKNDITIQALAKLPNYPPGITKRGEKPWPGADAQYTKDNVFAVRAFWSTGVGFNFPGVYQIAIHGKTGKNVATLSKFPNEAEVLFAPGTRFKVLSRDDSQAPAKISVVVQEL